MFGRCSHEVGAAISWVMPFRFLHHVWVLCGLEQSAFRQGECSVWGCSVGSGGCRVGPWTDVSFTPGKQNQALWLVMSLGCFLLHWHPGRGSRQQQQGECEQGGYEQGGCEQGGCEQSD